MGFRLDPNFKPFKLYKMVCVFNNVKQTKILPPKNQLSQPENSSRSQTPISNGTKPGNFSDDSF
jgi:hypothetical protein